MQTAPLRRPTAWFVAGVAALALAGCTQSGGGMGQVTQHGYILSDTALQQVPVGSSREQVLIALGTPSTTAEFGGEVFYYISQTRVRAVQFVAAGATVHPDRHAARAAARGEAG